jgi:signal transduction histidine kinase
MLTRFLPDRLSHLLVAIFVGAVLITQAFALVIFEHERARVVKDAEGRQAATCLAGFASMLANETPWRRWEILRPLLPQMTPEERRAMKARAAETLRAEESVDEFDIHLPLYKAATAQARTQTETIESSRAASPIQVSQLLPDGTNLKLSAPPTLSSQFLTLEFAAYLGAVLLVGLMGAVGVISLATMPLRRLSGAAGSFGTDVNAMPVPEEGPFEVRHAAIAFNRMQQRLKQFIADRTRMLAAISHDLQTPLTRLRLRAELMDSDEDRERMLADIDEMDQMIQVTLAFAREDNASEPSEVFDLRDLMRSIVDEDARTQAAMPPEPVAVQARPRALKRAIVNIVENAARYADGATVELRQEEQDVVIAIVDHGPGIDPAERENVLQPFYRCETSRSRDTGGTGLGLTITNDIVRAHGGTMALSETPGGGLTVEIRLAKPR